LGNDDLCGHLCTRIVWRVRSNRIFISSICRSLSVLLRGNLELARTIKVLTTCHQVVVACGNTDIRTWKSKINTFSLSGWESIRVKLIFASTLGADTKTGEIRVRHQRHKRHFHLAPIANRDGDRCQTYCVEKNWHYRV